jgi:hypothetical protein
MTRNTILINNSGVLKIQAEIKHSMIIENFEFQIQDPPAVGNLLNIDDALYIIYSNSNLSIQSDRWKEIPDYMAQAIDKKTPPSKLNIKQRERKINTFMHDNTQYVKIGKLYTKISDKDICTPIGHTTYYKYRARQSNEA